MTADFPTHWKELLAKPDTTLWDHTFHVAEGIHAIFGRPDAQSFESVEFFRFFKIAREQQAAFYASAFVSALLHDIGKANSEFQRAIWDARNKVENRHQQTIRHEHLSAMIVFTPTIYNWLKNLPGVDVDVVLSAVLCHHLKAFPRDKKSVKAFGTPRVDGRDTWKVYPELAFRVLDHIAEHFGVEPLRWQPEPWWGTFGKVDEFKLHIYKWNQKLTDDPDQQRLLVAVRAALILADGVGSGLVRSFRQEADTDQGLDAVNKRIRAWVQACFDDADPLTPEYIDANIIEPRKRQLGIANLNDWQVEARLYDFLACLIAPCGSGKTLAGWEFIKGVLARRREIRHVIWLFPTRGTANEIFRDYASYVPEADATVIHSTSRYELERLIEDTAEYDDDDSRKGKDFRTDDRLFGIGYWPKRVFCATVDQFIGFMQNSYQSICFLPILVNSVIVVDEVHSFDPDLFAAFRSFLRAFDIPCLVMTATLPPVRQHDFEELGFTVYPQDKERLAQFEQLANIKRYHIRTLPDLETAYDRAIEAFKKQKRTLWVVNSVGKCQDIAAELERRLGTQGVKPNVICYHSVFRLCDRMKRHRKTVDAFQGDAGAVIGVTTQVCEMSLDLDASVLITEEAPISSLAQRFGRSARHIHKLPKYKRKAAHVYVYPRQGENPDRPYDPTDFQGVPEFIAAIRGKVISQTELQSAIEAYAPAVQDPEVYVAFLNSGGWAVIRERDLRDIDEYRVNAILPTDMALYAALRAECKATEGLFVPAPRWAVDINRPSELPPASVKVQYRYSQEYGLVTG